MDLQTLRKKGIKAHVPQATIEKDYVLSVVLKELANSSLKEQLVFKGGTSIKKIYFEDARFSEDLDFSVKNATPNKIMTELDSLYKNKEFLDIAFKEPVKEKTSAGLRVSLKFFSYLNYPQKIRFDFSFRENIVLEPLEKEIIDGYGLGKATIKVLFLEEIFAEKIQALMSRTAARDLYDTWYLFKKGIKLQRTLVNKKFDYYKEKFDLKKLENKIDDFKSNWDKDLKQFLSKVPNQTDVVKEVIEQLSAFNK